MEGVEEYLFCTQYTGGSGIVCSVHTFGIKNLEHEFVVLAENNSLILQWAIPPVGP